MAPKRARDDEDVTVYDAVSEEDDEASSSSTEDDDDDEPPKKRGGAAGGGLAKLKQAAKKLLAAHKRKQRQNFDLAANAIADLVQTHLDTLLRRINEGESWEEDGQTRVAVCEIPPDSVLGKIVADKSSDDEWMHNLSERIYESCEFEVDIADGSLIAVLPCEDD